MCNSIKFNLLAVALLFFVCGQSGYGGSGTWNFDPVDDEWTNVNNWTPATIPNGPSDTATFGVSTQGSVSLSSHIELDSIVFEPSASYYVISASADGDDLAFFGSGVHNNSGVPQKFDFSATQTYLSFWYTAVAGRNVTYINNPVTAFSFTYTASADRATFVNNGFMEFSDSSTAASSTIIANGGSRTSFYSSSSSANARITANGGVGGNAGALIILDDDSTGDVRIELLGNATLDISFHSKPAATVGSIEGSGIVKLGAAGFGSARQLTIGSNDLSTTFSGSITDDNLRGSIAKVGRGRLILTGANTYGGSTVISGGQLLVNNATGSGTGTGSVRVQRGLLGGSGTIAGPVTIGGASGNDASLSPGKNASGQRTLTIQSPLTFHSGATYICDLNTSMSTIDSVVSNGLVIESSASATFADRAPTVLAPGTAFTVINNTSASPITGAFANLPDGGTTTISLNTFQANYQGGDGNDLTLTVIP
jgi:autotransporter-associated beta strand protein